MILENGFRFQQQKDYLSQSHRVHREERTPNLCDQVLQALKGSPNGRPDTSGISPGYPRQTNKLAHFFTLAPR